MNSITFLRRFVLTTGLISLWRLFFPLTKLLLSGYATYINSTFEGADVEFLYEESSAVVYLLYFTFWFWIYIDGFFREWEIVQFQYLEAAICLCRWIMLSIFFIFVPPFTYFFMYGGISAFTTVPRYLTYSTAIIYGAYCQMRVWAYPSEKIEEVTSWQRSQMS